VRWFSSSFDPIYVEDLRSIRYFEFWSKICCDRLNFMSLGVLGAYGKIILVFSPYSINLHILRLSLNTFCVFRYDFVFGKTTLTSSYSSHTLKYFLRILRIQLHTFREFSLDVPILFANSQNTQKEIFTFNKCLTMLKGQFFEKIEWRLKNWTTMNKFTNFIIRLYLTYNVVSAYLENTLNSDKKREKLTCLH
jgi:hypothetical protein